MSPLKSLGLLLLNADGLVASICVENIIRVKEKKALKKKKTSGTH